MTLEKTIKATHILPPEKLSDLIRLAVKDARRLNPDRYWPNASIYHQRLVYTRWDPDVYGPPPLPNACHVCVAGAVIAGTLKVSSDELRSPEDFESAWSGSLYALDYIRSGDYLHAYRAHYGVSYAQVTMTLRTKLHTLALDYPPVQQWFQDWDEFELHIDSLEVIANSFEREGL